MADQPPRPLRGSVSFPQIHLEDDPHLSSGSSAPPSPDKSNPFADPSSSTPLYHHPQPQQSRIDAERLIQRLRRNESPPSSTIPRPTTSATNDPRDDLETGETTRRGSLDSVITLPAEDPFGDRPGSEYAPGVLSHLIRLYHIDDQIAEEEDEGSEEDDLIRASRGVDEHTRIKREKKKKSGSDTETEKETFTHPRWYNAAAASRVSVATTAAEKEVEGEMKKEGSEGSVGGDGDGEETPKRRESPERLAKSTEEVKKAGMREKMKRGYSRVKKTMRDHRQRRKAEEETKITQHIAETLQRQKYILRLCRAFLTTGAPSHRLEEYLTTTAHVLSVSCSFVYLPGCMMISFNDSTTHTSDVQLVRAATNTDLGKLQHLHIIYKEVLHDVIGVDEGVERIENILKKPPRRNKWYRLLLYGGASAAIGPLFDARIHDLPFCFLLGSIVAFMALIINPKSEAFANCFEILASLVASFFARAIGSLRRDGKEIFCFSGIAQGAIAPLLLPGMIILTGALELQNKKLVAGAVRMFYAVIYSVLLWFGISLGTALYGAVDGNATLATKCSDVNLPEYRFFYAPLYAFFLGLANQAKWLQMPAMLVIATLSYTVTFFTQRRFPLTPQIVNALASFTVGVLGNLYSRIVHQAAYNVMVPAILLQVQSGISSAGSLAAGLKVAQTIVKGDKASPVDMAEFFVDGGMAELAYGLVAVAVGISFGLFASAVVVYPFGKRRSGFFSF